MPGGHTPFGTRVFQSAAPPIDPGALVPGPSLYFSGLASDGMNQAGGNLTNWVDKILGKALDPSVGSNTIPVVSSGLGLSPGVMAASMCGGNFFRGMDTRSTLPAFSNTKGYTQYLLVSALQGAPTQAYGDWLARWDTGANGWTTIYQGPGFDGSGGNFYFGDSAPGNVILQSGNGGHNTGYVTPANQSNGGEWDLWTLVYDGVSTTKIYRGGAAGPSINTGTVSLQTNLVFGGPSLGPPFVCCWVSAYILYTYKHTPSQIRGVRNWFRSHYGV